MDDQWNDGNESGEGAKTKVHEFQRDIEEGFAHLSAATGHFLSLTSVMEKAGEKLDVSLEAHRLLEEGSRQSADEGRSMLEEMRGILSQAASARDESREIQAQVKDMLGDLTALTTDLQNRIAALAVLGRPLPSWIDSAEERTTEASEPAYAEAF
jgi:hypothetical protein